MPDMATVITFDGITLPNPAPIRYTQTADTFEITIEGFDTSRTTIDALIAKASRSAKSTLLSGKVKVQTLGTKGDLVIGSDTYTNCVIMDDVKVEEVPGTGASPKWRYTIKFLQETIS